MLQAIIAYMPVVDTSAAIGSINYSRDEKVRLAKESINFLCECCGPILDIQKAMIAIEAKTPCTYFFLIKYSKCGGKGRN